MTLAVPSQVNSLELRRLARPKALEVAVLESLVEFIDRAAINPGGRLPSERVLCEALGVGRSTLREALKRWETLGIIERRQGSGVYLRVKVGTNLVHVPLVLAKPSNVRSLLQILQVRRALEGEAAALCASSASDATVAKIGDALETMETAHAAGDGSEADWQFHQTLYHATGNPFFPQIISSMRDLLHQLWENTLKLPDFAAASFPFHRTMYEAIRARDPDTARAEAWKLIDSVEREIREAFPEESQS
ncbi:FadR/GntR family transcriptional regulator [Aestuariivirga litoralis]|uniref:FadR/GntR family transcriptional regulator n=1 Tax=Aestuariivirga litoralis TaxID=2650924 RepID=UPI0018C74F00|nr:FadR/GntR family transcriptional regulator [Aestuariivirga litoralis]MBG1232369.1 FadR family transcriptional regulator [Aestuariivirga litoralis]